MASKEVPCVSIRYQRSTRVPHRGWTMVQYKQRNIAVRVQMILQLDNIPHIMAQLDRAGATLSAELVTHIDAHASHYAPVLRERLAQRLGLLCDEQAMYGRSHALIFLAQWHDAETLTMLGEILVRHDDMLDGLYEVFEATVPAFGPAAIPVLAHVMSDATAPTASRIVCTTTLGYIAHVYPLSARAIIRTLRDALPVGEDVAHDHHEVWSWVVTTLAELRSKAAAAQVDELYKAGVLDPNICGRPDEYRRALRESPIKAVFAQPLTLYS